MQTNELRAYALARHRDAYARMRDRPPEGEIVRYEGRDFVVYPHVFAPFEDSLALVRNYRIEKGERVLDVGTGSGIIAIDAAYKGASRVVALDISPHAVACAKENTRRHGFEHIIDVRLSDMFDALGDECFDVVTANLPFTPRRCARHRRSCLVGYRPPRAPNVFRRRARRSRSVRSRLHRPSKLWRVRQDAADGPACGILRKKNRHTRPKRRTRFLRLRAHAALKHRLHSQCSLRLTFPVQRAVPNRFPQSVTIPVFRHRPVPSSGISNMPK